MAASAAPSPAIVGRRLLGEIEETSLEDILQRIRAETAARAAADAGLSAQQHGGGQTHGRPVISGSGGAATSAVPPVNAGASSAAATTTTAVPALRVLPSFPIPALQQLVAHHFRSTRAPELVVGGQRPLALVYLLVATLVAAPLRQTVVVVDAEARFDARQLLGVQPRASTANAPAATAAAAAAVMAGDGASSSSLCNLSAPVTEDDLQHVHVFRVDPRWRVPLAELVAAAEQRVMYGGQRRRDRPWWGTIVVGGASGSSSVGGTGGRASSSALGHSVGASLVTGPYGWLRVDRQEQDAVAVQQERQRQLLALFESVNLHQVSQDEDEAAAAPDKDFEDSAVFKPVIWTASSPWGKFTFQISKSMPIPL
ncbi:MAG: hypothetical protein STHCBS139747_000739 [Sporothrix thermara]